jgi:predicted phosphodiesterase
MRLAVLADIHANLPALEAVIEDASKTRIDRYLVAGDLLLGATFPHETIELLRSLDPIMILGNRDRYLLDYHDGSCQLAYHHQPQWTLLRWTYAHLAQEDIRLLSSLPEQAVFDETGLPPIRMVHGSLERINGGLVPDADPAGLAAFHQAGWPMDKEPPCLAQAVSSLQELVLICGHTHIAWQQMAGDHLVLNPGSAGHSTNGDPRAYYAVLEFQEGRWKADQRAIAYDLAKVRADFEASGLLDQDGGFSRATLANLLSGQNVAWFFVLHINAICQSRGGDPANGWSDADVMLAQKTFPWEKYQI